MHLAVPKEGARRTARGGVGLRLRVTRVDARAELSQDESDEVVARIAAELDAVEPALAEHVRRARSAR